MPGNARVISELYEMTDKFVQYETKSERRAYLTGLLSGKFTNADYCIITAIFYLTLCEQEVTRETLRDYLGEKIPQLDHAILRVLNSRHVKEDKKTKLLALVR
jgi:basic membrane lipoprotein Med (substrate-binding protein (PBP1-ABC) superfamily)